MRFIILSLFKLFVLLFLISCEENKQIKTNEAVIEKKSSSEVSSENDAKKGSKENRESDLTSTLSSHLIQFKLNIEVDDFYVKFNELMNANPGMMVTNTFDHQEKAESVGMTIDFSSFHHLYTNQLINPLINENPLVALDLPLRIHFFKDDNNDFAQFVDGHYLIKRYGLEESIQTAESNSRVLNSIVKNLSNQEKPFQNSDLNFKELEGIEILQSTSNFDETAKSILHAIKKNKEVDLIAAHDFQSFAQEANYSIGKCILLLYGNPEMGSSLMQERPSLGIDLPLKMLLYETKDGVTHVAYNNMEFIFGLHDYQNTEAANKLNQLTATLITGKK
ncbi:DUF302 domain-containing protein [Psychroflexus maritimus]|uniref:DUF302 domain-containing protein n=1 Tax=Psychroflexus maritimus TaxID=2714865 RepID=A0A967AH73_9FLAO|nr:DUF302 domain-containing protein [Psychroflexus maritimus]NGZ89340.1 DUF302 domain-containing protein [Psychroflexus maritimus]